MLGKVGSSVGVAIAGLLAAVLFASCGGAGRHEPANVGQANPAADSGVDVAQDPGNMPRPDDVSGPAGEGIATTQQTVESGADYTVMRAAYLDILAEDLAYLSAGPDYAFPLNLYNCTSPEFYGASEGMPGRLALDSAYVEVHLAIHPSPRSQWEGRLRAFETRMLMSHRQDPSGSALAYEERRDAFLAELASGLGVDGEAGEVLYLGECGAGEDRFTLASDPADASIHLITRWNKLVCDGMKVDAYDPVACTGWRQMRSSSVVSVVGEYHYMAAWPDGRTHRGRLSFDDDSLDSTVTLTPAGPLYR